MTAPPETTDTAPDDREQLRAGLLEQLAHLLREVEMLEPVIGRVPEKLLAETPPGERFSIKETFGLLARLDDDVRPARLERILGEEAPRFEPQAPTALLADGGWSDRSPDAIFARVRAARQGLIDAFDAVPPEDWLRTGHFPKAGSAQDSAEDASADRSSEKRGLEERDLYEMAHAVCLHDTRRLRAMSRRLYESHLGPPPEEMNEW